MSESDNSKKSKKGGPQPGSGRPRVSEEATKQYSIRLPDSVTETLKEAGPEKVRSLLIIVSDLINKK